MKIPVLVSIPTTLNAAQMISYGIIINQLNNLQLEPRRLGESDYPNTYPLR